MVWRSLSSNSLVPLVVNTPFRRVLSFNPVITTEITLRSHDLSLKRFEWDVSIFEGQIDVFNTLRGAYNNLSTLYALFERLLLTLPLAAFYSNQVQVIDRQITN